MNRNPEITARVGELPALDERDARILACLRDPDSSVPDIVDLVSCDGELSRNVLVRAGVDDDTSLGRGLVMIGIDALTSMVVRRVCEPWFRQVPEERIGHRLWDHSIAVARAARSVARQCHHPRHEEAFLAGLLHDAGYAILDANAPDVYHQVISLQSERPDLSRFEAEREMLGFDHGAVGAMLADSWDLPGRIAEAIRYHHDPMRANEDPALAAVVAFADDLCTRIGIGVAADPELRLEHRPATAMLSISPERLSRLVRETKKTLYERAGA